MVRAHGLPVPLINTMLHGRELVGEALAVAVDDALGQALLDRPAGAVLLLVARASVADRQHDHPRICRKAQSLVGRASFL